MMKIKFILVTLLAFSNLLNAQDSVRKKHETVAMRMIGHQLLLMAGDSTSRVMPIEEEEGQYRISFETALGFQPELISSHVDSILRKANLPSQYIVEVEDCETKSIVYSYESAPDTNSSILPCMGRALPEACYTVLVSFYEAENLFIETEAIKQEEEEATNWAWLLVPILALFIALFMLKRSKRSNPNLIRIGELRFDKLNSELLVDDRRFELTSKEADLLMLLYNSANTTVERDVILNQVWGDEGDYVGRTLDVFISKLRKKLEADEKVKIVNTRGVGYKLIVQA